MDKIAEIDSAPQVEGLAQLFPEAGTLATQAFTRPYGTVKVLLGMPSWSVHCKDGRQA